MEDFVFFVADARLLVFTFCVVMALGGSAAGTGSGLFDGKVGKAGGAEIAGSGTVGAVTGVALLGTDGAEALCLGTRSAFGGDFGLGFRGDGITNDAWRKGPGIAKAGTGLLGTGEARRVVLRLAGFAGAAALAGDAGASGCSTGPACTGAVTGAFAGLTVLLGDLDTLARSFDGSGLGAATDFFEILEEAAAGFPESDFFALIN